MEVLDSEGVVKAIEEACSFTTKKYFQTGKSKALTLRLALPEDLPTLIFPFLGQNSAIDPRHAPESINTKTWNKESCRLDVPNFFGLALVQKTDQDTNKLFGLVTFHFAYSTWDGRVVYLDRFLLPKDGTIKDMDIKAIEYSLHYTLADIAIRLDCARYTWQHTLPLPTFPGSVQPEYLKGWLTLHQKQESDPAAKDEPWSSESDRAVIVNCLEKLQNEQRNSDFRLRLSTADDIGHIERLVHGLALYEKEPESVHVFGDHYRRDGFMDSQPPLFHCILLESITGNQAYVCGMAFCFFGYTFGEGRFFYLEDLFIEKEYRGKGGGELTMSTLAEIARSLNCIRMAWQALDWNTPALNFYAKIGAKVQDGLLTSRYPGEDLLKFHQNREGY